MKKIEKEIIKLVLKKYSLIQAHLDCSVEAMFKMRCNSKKCLCGWCTDKKTEKIDKKIFKLAKKLFKL